MRPRFIKMLIFLLSALLIFQISVFAEEEKREIFNSYEFYTGNVYLINEDNSSVIFRNVKKANSHGFEEFAIELEYTELSMIPANIYSDTGENINAATINSYFLDQKVSFLAAKSSNRVRIIYMEFVK